jgi:hypothetical protein
MRVHKTLLWKIYFWIVAFLLIVSFIIVIVVENKFSVLLAIDISLGLVAIAGTYGYVYQIRILKEKFWKQYFPFMIVWELLYSIVYSSFINYSGSINLRYIAWMAFTYLLAIPMFLSLYRYSYCLKEFWNKQKKSIGDIHDNSQ